MHETVNESNKRPHNENFALYNIIKTGPDPPQKHSKKLYNVHKIFSTCNFDRKFSRKKVIAQEERIGNDLLTILFSNVFDHQN